MTEAVTRSISAPIAENIPDALKRRPQWVVWKLEEREGVPTKVLYTPGTHRRALSTDLISWRSFDESLTAYEAQEPPCDGLGFVFCSADCYVGVDLDNCRDPESGVVEDWAKEVIKRFRTPILIEASPSGTGIHVITRGKLQGGTRKGNLEIYDQDRYFTITGHIIDREVIFDA